MLKQFCFIINFVRAGM